VSNQWRPDCNLRQKKSYRHHQSSKYLRIKVFDLTVCMALWVCVRVFVSIKACGARSGRS
jgi:hypothetical protein